MLKHNNSIETDVLEKKLMQGRLTEEDISNLFSESADIILNSEKHSSSVLAFYCEGMIDHNQYNEYFNKVVNQLSEPLNEHSNTNNPPVVAIKTISEMINKVFSGYLLLYKEKDNHFYGVGMSNIPKRDPEESKTETAIKGSRDGFTEEIATNISLVRKRLKTDSLSNITFELGSLSPTKVSLLYIKNKANAEIINEIKLRLEKINTECVTSSGQLEQWLSDRTFSIFPLFDYITSPDFAVECLLRGRFLIIVDGSPSVLIGPTNLLELLKAPEDVHFPYYLVAFQRFVRFLGFQISIFLPGFYIAITHVNIDQLPFSLLATIVVSREGLPLSIPLETFTILILFELLREAGIRMPTVLGQTISIVGGLIIGDAAIRAGLTSPTLLVVIAISAVSTFTLVNQSLTGTVTLLRLFSLILATFLGIYGFAISFFSIIIYASQLESFKVPYLEPITSLDFKEYLNAFFINPFNRKHFTVKMLKKRRK